MSNTSIRAAFNIRFSTGIPRCCAPANKSNWCRSPEEYGDVVDDHGNYHWPCEIRRRYSAVLGAGEGSAASWRRRRSRSSWLSTSNQGLMIAVFMPNWSNLAVVEASVLEWLH